MAEQSRDHVMVNTSVQEPGGEGVSQVIRAQVIYIGSDAGGGKVAGITGRALSRFS